MDADVLSSEDNELELKEGEYITNIDMVDENWWMGQNASGQAGLFPANYVELVDNDTNAFDNTATPAPPSRPGGEDVDTASAPVSAGPTATALYDYEAAGQYFSYDKGHKLMRSGRGQRNQLPGRCQDYKCGKYHRIP